MLERVVSLSLKMSYGCCFFSLLKVMEVQFLMVNIAALQFCERFFVGFEFVVSVSESWKVTARLIITE